jgi:hypothetical protein
MSASSRLHVDAHRFSHCHGEHESSAASARVIRLAVLPIGMPREQQALAYITTLKQLGVCATVSTTHAKSTAT